MNFNPNNIHTGRYTEGEETIDIRVPGELRLPDLLIDAILFLFGKAGYKCKLTIMPLTRYNHPEPPQPYVAPTPYGVNPDNTWEKWSDNVTNYPRSFQDWMSQNSTAKEPK